MALEDIYNFFFDEKDVATKTNFGHPSVVPTVLVLYVVFCKWAGPALMKNSKPFQLKSTLIVYNCAQVLANAYVVVQLFQSSVKGWPVRCHRHEVPELYQSILEDTKLLQWHIYLVKFVDLLDAVFFVIRKKQQQVTFLHLFHHVVVCSLCHIYIFKTNYAYIVIMGLTINTFIHVVMYLYYALAAFGPEMQKYLWWKKHLTLMQIIQFAVVLLYMVISMATGCDTAGILEIVIFLFTLALLFLFVNFYKKSFKTE